MELLTLTECLDDLMCPACGSERLAATGEGVTCLECERSFPCRRGVVDFVLAEALGSDGQRERAANAVDLDSERAVERRLRKGERNPFLMAQARRSIRAAERLMAECGEARTLVSVGSGSGFELRVLLERRRFERVYSSDVAWTATALVPETTVGFDGRLGLFSADFDHLPLRRRREHVGFVFQALHHAEDPYGSLARLLERNFEHLVVVEPVTNWFVELLARTGLARRVEYSGVEPQWLRLRRVREVARELGYAVRVETWWEIPRDRVPRRLRRSRYAWRPLYALAEAVSWVLRPFEFGSMVAIRFSIRS
jgi:hypothetical protein